MDNITKAIPGNQQKGYGKKFDWAEQNMKLLKNVPAGKMVNTPFGGAMMRSGHELDEGSKRMQSLSKVSRGYGKTMITRMSKK